MIQFIRPYSDSWSNFTVVDTNNPASIKGQITKFDFYASRINPIHFVVIDEDDVVKWISDEIKISETGMKSYVPREPIHVYENWNVGVHFTSTGSIPFEYYESASLAGYTNLNSGLPHIGEELTYVNVGNRKRKYSYNATLVPTEKPKKVTGGAEKIKADNVYFSLAVNAIYTGKNQDNLKGKIQYTRDDLKFHASTKCAWATSDGTVATVAGPVTKVQEGSVGKGKWAYVAIKEGGTGSGDRVRVRLLSEEEAKANCFNPYGEYTFPGVVEKGEFKIRL